MKNSLKNCKRRVRILRTILPKRHLFLAATQPIQARIRRTLTAILTFGLEAAAARHRLARDAVAFGACCADRAVFPHRVSAINPILLSRVWVVVLCVESPGEDEKGK